MTVARHATQMTILLFTMTAFAGTREAVFEIQHYLEDRIRPAVRTYDPLALVYVTVQVRSENKALPMTPFMAKNIMVLDTGSSIQIARAEIRILITKSKLPESIAKLVMELSTPLGVKPTIKVESMPEVLGNEDKTDPKISDSNSFLEKFKKAWEQSPYAFMGVGIAWLGLVFYFIIFLVRFYASKKFQDALAGGFAQLSAAIETAAMGGGGARAPAAIAQEARAASRGADRADGQLQIQKKLEEYPKESLLALMTDCYWGGKDSYAAFLWRRISISRRQALVGMAPLLETYGGFLAGMSEEDLGADEDAYYLSPLPIFLIDNTSLTLLVRENPALMQRLPSLRVRALEFTARERIESARLALKPGEKPSSLPDFNSLKPSTLRELKIQMVFEIKSIEEEREVLAMPELLPDDKLAIPSLGWLAQLSKEKITEILQTYSARDLASAWVGPPEVLEVLGSALPKRKAELLESYSKNAPASRSSAAFLLLHRAGVEELARL